MSFLQTWDKARILSSIALIEGGVIKPFQPISVVNRITTDINTPYDRGHSINQYNSHVIEKPPEYSFVIAIAAISDEVELLRDVQSSGIYFQMELKDENDTTGEEVPAPGNREYKLCREYFNYCKLTRKRAEVTVGEVPMVIFDGIALEYSYDYWTQVSDVWTIQAINSGGTRYWFGHGEPIPIDVPLYANFEADAV